MDLTISDDSSSSNSFVKISSGMSDLSDSESNSELMKKKVECEEELKTTSLKIQESEQEIEKLKSEAKNKESDLRAKLETAQRETEIKDIAVETEKRRVVNLENNILMAQKRLRKQQSDITLLLANKTCLESMVRDMEDQIENSNAEKLELQREINALKTDLVNPGECIEVLKTDLVHQGEDIKALKKECEMQKQRFDKLEEEDEFEMAGLFVLIAALIVYYFIQVLRDD